MIRFTGLILLGAALSACSGEEAPIERDGQAKESAERTAVEKGASDEVLEQTPSDGAVGLVRESRAPVQDMSTQEEGEAPRHLVKAPPFRRATPDEVESLNGTYRTEGSWDHLLRGIEFARDEETRRVFISVFSRVQKRLPDELRARAEEKMAAALARVEERGPRRAADAIPALPRTKLALSAGGGVEHSAGESITQVDVRALRREAIQSRTTAK